VRQQQHQPRALGARGVDLLLQVLLLDAELPVGDEVARIGDRRIRKGLADDGHRHAGHLAQHIGRKHRIAEVGGLDVVRDEVDAALQFLVDDLAHALHAVGELPMAGHDVDAEQPACVDHVLAPGPQRRGRALPGVAAVEQQRARTAGLEPLDERGQVREAADRAVALGRAFEVEAGVGMRERAARGDVRCLQEALADQMRPVPGHRAETEVDAGLAEVQRPQLRVAVGEVQQADEAAAATQRRQLVQRLFGRRGIGLGPATERHAGGAGSRQHLKEFAAAEVHRTRSLRCVR